MIQLCCTKRETLKELVQKKKILKEMHGKGPGLTENKLNLLYL